MNQITGTIQNIFSDRPLQEDEYRNESDNLIHCAKCKTPRQHHVVVLGKEMVVPIRCRCQQEVQDKEEAERKHREFLDQVSRLKANGLQDKSLREYTFANDKGYNLVVVGTNGYWTGNFPDEEHAHRFAYENGIELD